MNVLVAYATSHGSTTEVARRIGSVLEQNGHTVTVREAQYITDVNGYEAFVLGTAIESGAWLPALTDFVMRFENELSIKPVYVWVNCIRVMEEFGMSHIMEYYMPKELLAKLNLRRITALAGKLDLKSVDWTERWTLSTRYDGHAWPTNFDGDFRDWDKIFDWAISVLKDLQSVKLQQG